MPFSGFPADTVAFLGDLRANNDRDWFKANRSRYEAAVLEPAKEFIEALAGRFAVDGYKGEPKVDRSIRRLNRDTRFHAGKGPFKDHLDLMLWMGDYDRSAARPVLYLRIGVDEWGYGSGMHAFDKDALARYRTAVAGGRGETLADIVAALRSAGQKVEGEEYKKVPAGFDPDHPRAALLRHKSLWAHVTAPVPRELVTPRFVDLVEKGLRAGLPLNAWLDSNVATDAAARARTHT